MSLRVKHTDLNGETLDERRLKGVKLETAGPMFSLAEARASSWPAWLVIYNLPGAIRMRWLRVSGPGTPLYGEIRWFTKGYRKVYIGGVDTKHPPPPRDYGRVCRWLRAVEKKLPDLGRPPGRSDLTPEELERAVRRAIAPLLKECRPLLRDGRRHVTSDRVAQILSRDKDLNLPRTTGKQLRDRLSYHQRPTFTQLLEEEMHRLGFK